MTPPFFLLSWATSTQQGKDDRRAGAGERRASRHKQSQTGGDWAEQTNVTLPLSSQGVFLVLSVHWPQPAGDHRLHETRGRRGGDKTLPSSGTLESRVEKSHPGQKDKCFSDVTGVVGRAEALNSHPST